MIEHYKFCHGSTGIFDGVRTILGLDIWFIAYVTQIFILFPVQSNPRQLIGAPSPNFFITSRPTISDSGFDKNWKCSNSALGIYVWFSTFWAWNLAIQILTWCTKQDDGHWAKLCLGDSFLHLPKLTRLLPLWSESGQMIVRQKRYPSMFCYPTFGIWSIRINNRLI